MDFPRTSATPGELCTMDVRKVRENQDTDQCWLFPRLIPPRTGVAQLNRAYAR